MKQHEKETNISNYLKRIFFCKQLEEHEKKYTNCSIQFHLIYSVHSLLVTTLECKPLYEIQWFSF